MKNSNITLLTAAIRSGKTTALFEWQKKKTNIHGILSPDIEGFRKIINLHSQEIIDFELAKENCANDLKIGRFIFAKAAFDEVHKILFALCNENTPKNLIIIDEIGKLELMGEGFEPALSAFFDFYKEKNTPILCVVRDYLLQEVIEKYHFQTANIYHFTGEIHLHF